MILYNLSYCIIKIDNAVPIERSGENILRNCFSVSMPERDLAFDSCEGFPYAELISKWCMV